MNQHQKALMVEVPLMKCANMTEFKQRLQWLSEGYLRINLLNLHPYEGPDKAEIEIYRRFKETK
jgi:hypothetical protein